MSKRKITSVMDTAEQDIDTELDEEYKQDMIKGTNDFFKEYNINSKCINICADIRAYLDKNAVSDELFNNICVDDIKQLLYEIDS